MSKRLTKKQREAAREELKRLAAKGDWPAIAAEIRQTVEIAPPVRDYIAPMVGDVGTFTYGDSVEIEVKEGVTAYIITDGADAVRDQVSFGTIKPEAIQIACFPTVYIPDLRAGRYERILDLGTDVPQAFLKQANFYVWNACRKAVQAGDDTYYAIATDAITAATLKACVRKIKDNSGGAVSIVGRQTAVQGICDFSGFSDETLRETEMEDWLGRIYGANVIGLQDIVDEWGLRKRGATLIGDTDILVVGRGGFAYRETELDMLPETQVGPLRQGWRYWKHIMGCVINPAYIGRIEILG